MTTWTNSRYHKTLEQTKTMAPQLIFGTGVLGMDGTDFQDKDSVTNLLNALKQLHIIRLDTAARYPPFNPARPSSSSAKPTTATRSW